MKRIICLIISVILLMTSVIGYSAEAVDYDLSDYKDYADVLVSMKIAEKSLLSKSADSGISNKEFAGYVSEINGGLELEKYGITSANLERSIDYERAVKIMLDIMGYNPDGKFTRYAAKAKSLGITENIIHMDKGFTRYDAVVLLYNCLKTEVYVPAVFKTEWIVSYVKGDRTLSQICCNARFFEGVIVSTPYGYINKSVGSDDNLLYIKTDDEVLEIQNCEKDLFGFLGYRAEGFVSNDEDKNLIDFFIAETDTLTIDYKCQPYINDKNLVYTNEAGMLKKVGFDYNAAYVVNGEPISSFADFEDALADSYGMAFYQVRFINNDSDKAYDVVALERYRNIVIENVSTKTLSIVDVLGKGFDHSERYDDKLVEIVDAEGNTLTLKDIKTNDTLSVFENANKQKQMRVVVSDRYDRGCLSSVKRKASLEYEIDYTDTDGSVIADVIDCDYTSKAEVGEVYGFCFDFSGRVAGKIKDVIGSNDGVFVKLRVDGTFSEKAELLMFGGLKAAEETETAEPELKVYKLKDSAKCDGVKITKDNVDEINRSLFHTIVSYDVNSDGEIYKIRSADIEDAGSGLETLNRHSPLASAGEKVDTEALAYTYENGFSGFRSATSKTVAMAMMDVSVGMYTPYPHLKVIAVPDISLDEANMGYKYNYGVLNVEDREQFVSIDNKDRYKVEGYFTPNGVVPEYIVNIRTVDNKPESDAELISRTDILLVGDVSTVINPETEQECTKIVGLYRGKEMELYTSDEKILDYTGINKYIDISEGDVLFVNFDVKGNISYGIRIYDYANEKVDIIISSGKFPDISEGTVPYSDVNDDYIKHKIFTGYLYSVSKRNTGLYIIPDKTVGFLGAMLNKVGFPGTNRDNHTYIYNTQKNKGESGLKVGTYSDGITYLNSRDEASKVVVRNRNGYCTDVIIYK